jgi:hypothetical protein
MEIIHLASLREGCSEGTLNISYLSVVAERRQRIAKLLQVEHRNLGCIETSRNRDCQLFLSSSPRSGLAVVKHHSPELIITDSRFDWDTPWSQDGIPKVIRRLRRQNFLGKIFCLGMYGIELNDAIEAGADGFMEEDEAFSIDLEHSRRMVCEGIRALLEHPPFVYFPKFPE